MQAIFIIMQCLLPQYFGWKTTKGGGGWLLIRRQYLYFGIRVGGGAGGNRPPSFSYTKKGQRWPNPKYCVCGGVRDNEFGSQIV